MNLVASVRIDDHAVSNVGAALELARHLGRDQLVVAALDIEEGHFERLDASQRLRRSTEIGLAVHAGGDGLRDERVFDIGTHGLGVA